MVAADGGSKTPVATDGGCRWLEISRSQWMAWHLEVRVAEEVLRAGGKAAGGSGCHGTGR